MPTQNHCAGDGVGEMRTIIVRYAGECRKCGSPLEAGTTATHERHIGLFCPTCAPTDLEEIRQYRQEAANRRADRLDDWAEKREARAAAVLNNRPAYASDWAFITQPGHIPARARLIAREDKARENLHVAQGLSDKADRLRAGVRVKGDAAAKDQAKREAILKVLKVGMRVETWVYGQGIVAKINKKTATIAQCGVSGTARFNVDLSFLRILDSGSPDVS